jgi:hypothetical protein
MLIIVILFYIVIVLVDPINLLKQGLKKDFYVSSLMCILSFIIAVSLALKIGSFSPAKPIEGLFKFMLQK